MNLIKETIDEAINANMGNNPAETLNNVQQVHFPMDTNMSSSEDDCTTELETDIEGLFK